MPYEDGEKLNAAGESEPQLTEQGEKNNQKSRKDEITQFIKDTAQFRSNEDMKGEWPENDGLNLTIVGETLMRNSITSRMLRHLGSELSKLRGIADPKDSMEGYYGHDLGMEVASRMKQNPKQEAYEVLMDEYNKLKDEIVNKFPDGEKRYRDGRANLDKEERQRKANTIRGKLSSLLGKK